MGSEILQATKCPHLDSVMCSELYAELADLNSAYAIRFYSMLRDNHVLTIHRNIEKSAYIHAEYDMTLLRRTRNYHTEWYEIEYMLTENMRNYAFYSKKRRHIIDTFVGSVCDSTKMLVADILHSCPPIEPPVLEMLIEYVNVFVDEIHDQNIYELNLSKFSEWVKEVRGSHVRGKWRIKYCDSMAKDGHKFEQFCKELLLKIGFSQADVTSGSGDFGTDILAEKDGITYAIQCKCHSHGNNVGNKAVQEIFSGREFYKTHVGVVFTNQYYTSAAIEHAKRTGVILWDRKILVKMLENAKQSVLPFVLKQIDQQLWEAECRVKDSVGIINTGQDASLSN